jgi:flagellin
MEEDIMPGVGGLSIANNLLANQASLNLNNNQKLMQGAVSKLSSGLRINTAADDPSGLAIAEGLQSQVNGFDQASMNVQDANNAATVAEGALQTTTDILQRIRTLAVEASNDSTSQTDKGNLQTEVGQLLQEVNRVSQNTQFNGENLLDGSHAGFVAQVSAYATVENNASLATNGGVASNGWLAAKVDTTAANFNTTVGAVQSGASTGATVDGTIMLQVVNTGTSIAVQETFINSATGVSSTSTTLFSSGQVQTVGTNTFDNVAISFGAFTTADVGATSYIKISQNVAALSNPANTAFSFQAGSDEGSTIQVGFQATNTQTLRISNINLMVTASGANSLGAEDAIGQIDNALHSLLTQRAQLGAAMVRLQEAQNNNNIASVNMQASESQIRDLNVASQTTQYTKLQILVQVGTSILSQANQNAQSVTRLFQ